MTTAEYLKGPEDTRRRELVYGVVREPPSPFGNHQLLVTRLTVLLETYVREHGLGIVLVSPMDVVLDANRALVVQPDVLFISGEREGILQNQVWGAPDLVVEVGSGSRSRYDRVTKMRWYREYGCREYWIVEPLLRTVEVFDLERSSEKQIFNGEQIVTSSVLPGLRFPARRVFER